MPSICWYQRRDCWPRIDPWTPLPVNSGLHRLPFGTRSRHLSKDSARDLCETTGVSQCACYCDTFERFNAIIVSIHDQSSSPDPFLLAIVLQRLCIINWICELCCCCLRCSERASYDSAQPHTLTYGPLPPLPTIYVMCMSFLTNISRIISETRCSCYGYIVVESFLNRVWARFQWKTGRMSTDIRYITPDLSYLR